MSRECTIKAKDVVDHVQTIGNIDHDLITNRADNLRTNSAFFHKQNLTEGNL